MYAKLAAPAVYSCLSRIQVYMYAKLAAPAVYSCVNVSKPRNETKRM
jgi:hypothetical protein